MTVNIVVRGRHMDVSQKFRALAEEKLNRLERFGLPISLIDVEVSRELNPRMADRAIEVELTAHGPGPLLRAEAHAGDKYIALEYAYETMTERLRRLADKRRSQRRRHARVVSSDFSEEALGAAELLPDTRPEPDEALPPGVVLAEGPIIVREKTHETKPMTVVQALDALEAVGHDFYFFYDQEANRPSVIYARRGYDYGLIRLDVEAINGGAAS